MGRRILVADDSSTIQKVIKIAFSPFEVDILEAASYIEALAAVGRGAPDVLIIDASLPGARGPQDFAKLKADAGGAPLLLLVGTYEAVDEVAFRNAGFEQILKKPFESSDIVATVDRLLGGDLIQRGGPPQAAGAAGQGSVPPTPAVAAPTYSRSQHATVIHEGGYQTLSAYSVETSGVDGAAGAPEYAYSANGLPTLETTEEFAGELPTVPPPPPVTDAGRRGRPAFTPPAVASGRERAPHPEGGRSGAGASPPLPPLSLSLDDEPENGRYAGRPSSVAETAPHSLRSSPFGSQSSRDISLTLEDEEEAAGDGDEAGLSSLPAPPVSRSTRPVQGVRAREGELLAALGPLLEEQLPELVREAVLAYCERHFKSLAREIIATELRRLADEKARHLVDN